MKAGFRATTLIAALTGVSSCSLIDPHVTMSTDQRDAVFYKALTECHDIDPATGRIKLGADGKPIDGKPERQSPYCQFYGNLPGAVAYAYALSEEYDGAVSSQSVLKNGLALGLIPASAAALYFGISGSHPDAILATATGGAAALGLGTFLSSQPRQAVYTSGSLALGCAIAKSSPYLLDKDQYRSISPNFTLVQARLTNNIKKANEILTNLGPLDPNDFDGAQDRARASITVAQQALADAGALNGKAMATRMKVDQAGVNLVQMVSTISEKVSREVVKTEPDISAIKGITAGLGSSVLSQVQGIAKVDETLNPPPKSTAGGPPQGAEEAMAVDAAQRVAQLKTQLAEAVGYIDADALELRQNILTVQPLIEAITAKEQIAAAIPECTVAPAEVPGFTVSPPDTTFNLKVGEAKSLIVNGAFGNATGTVVSGPPSGLETATTASGAGLMITMTGKTAGTYIVAISDASGKGTKTINVVVAQGLTLKIAGKDVGDEITVVKGGTPVTIAVSGGSGDLTSGIDGERVTSKSQDNAASGSVTVSADSNADTAQTHVLTITAGSEVRKIKVKVAAQ